VNRAINPTTVGAPSANYALATEADNPARLLHTSGIGPVRTDGSVPESTQGQAETVWSTVLTLLAEAGMTPTDVVSVTTYVVVPDPLLDEDLPTRLALAMAARDAHLDGHRCSSVLVPVPALATPSWKLEVAVVAASSRQR
jgi:enamine deaminase RidA (YjgF/YER057c/UK114 family)